MLCQTASLFSGLWEHCTLHPNSCFRVTYSPEKVIFLINFKWAKKFTLAHLLTTMGMIS